MGMTRSVRAGALATLVVALWSSRTFRIASQRPGAAAMFRCSVRPCPGWGRRSRSTRSCAPPSRCRFSRGCSGPAACWSRAVPSRPSSHGGAHERRRSSTTGTGGAAPLAPPIVMLCDETLRDGLQSPSVRTPSIAQKIRILHLLDRIGIDTTDIGLPGAGPHVVRDVERLAREIVEAKLEDPRELRGAHRRQRHRADRRDLAAYRPADRVLLLHRLQPRSAGTRRTGPSTTCSAAPRRPIALRGQAGPRGDVRHRGHHALGSRDAAAAVPTAIRAGASRLCIADTVGHATPAGARAVVRFARRVIDGCGRPETSASTGTATATAAWARSTAWRRSKRAPRACTAPSWARRARRQHAARPAAGEPGADGVGRARSRHV